MIANKCILEIRSDIGSGIFNAKFCTGENLQ